MIPRLVLAGRASLVTAGPPGDIIRPDAEEVAAFAQLVLRQDASAATSFIEDLLERGAALETVYLDLLSPAARQLGELWNEDLCDFTEVTMALGRMQQLLRELSMSFQPEVDQPQAGRRALLVPAPGEQHTFGLLMVTEFFRRAGWEVSSAGGGSPTAVVNAVRGEWFAIVGFSISSDRRLDALASCIRNIRRASLNRGIGVLVGGPLLVMHPELVPLVGADATAADARQAARQAESLLELMAQRS